MKTKGHLSGARVYLSGPMDFVASRAQESRFGWAESPLDAQERGRRLEKPLLPFLEKLNHDLPKKWHNRLRKYVPNDDWLLWDL